MALYERFEDGDADDPFSDYSETDPVAISQSFTIGTTSTNQALLISAIHLHLKRLGGPASDLTIELREWDSTNNVPSNYILATESVISTDVETSLSWINCGDFGQTTLTANSKYCIVVRGGVNTTIDQYYWRVKASGGYSGGGNSSSTDDGVSFTAEGSADHNFRIYGVFWTSNIVSYLSVLSKIGQGASATAKGFEYANKFVEIAEGYVNALTRYDWGTNWNTLNTKARRLVEQAVSCLAAIDIIGYDYTGYGSRFEAREKIMELRNLANIALEALKDENIKAYIQAGD